MIVVERGGHLKYALSLLRYMYINNPTSVHHYKIERRKNALLDNINIFHNSRALDLFRSFLRMAIYFFHF